MFKSKRNIAILVSSITIVLLIFIAMMFSPTSKVSGGYSDTLESNNVVLRITSTNLFKDQNKTMLEVYTSVWNKNGQLIEVKNSDFSMNSTTPQNTFTYTINKNERMNIRQVYEFNGPVSSYYLNIKGQKFSFDFTLKNNELQSKNLKLVGTSVDEKDTKIAIEKQETEAIAQREAAAKKAEEDRATLKKEADKLKQEEANKPVVVFDVFGKYNSNTTGDATSIVLNNDLSANVHIACDTGVKDLFVPVLKRVDNQNVVSLSGEYTFQDKKGTISMEIERNNLVVKDSEFKCLMETKYFK